MNMQRADCHIKLMSAETASRVPAIAREIASALDNEIPKFHRNGNAPGLTGAL
jgi:hypothetical protein